MPEWWRLTFWKVWSEVGVGGTPRTQTSMDPNQNNSGKTGPDRQSSHSGMSRSAHRLAINTERGSIRRAGGFCSLVSQADDVRFCAVIPRPEIVQVAVKHWKPATVYSEINRQILLLFSGERRRIIQTIL